MLLAWAERWMIWWENCLGKKGMLILLVFFRDHDAASFSFKVIDIFNRAISASSRKALCVCRKSHFEYRIWVQNSVFVALCSVPYIVCMHTLTQDVFCYCDPVTLWDPVASQVSIAHWEQGGNLLHLSTWRGTSARAVPIIPENITHEWTHCQ